MRTVGGGRATWAAIRSTLMGMAIVGGLLLIPAGLVPGGTWAWPQGLTLTAAYGAITGVGNVTLALWRPEHFQVRQQGVVAAREKRQPLIDAVGSAILLVVVAVWLVFMPLDVFWLHLLAPPGRWIALAGGAASLLGAALTPLAVWENRFATPNVQQQVGQAIVRSGVYAFIRHPIYLGNLLLTGGATLWLGSYAGLWGFACVLIATIGRIRVEEGDLRARVPEYASYATEVRARLIPFLF